MEEGGARWERGRGEKGGGGGEIERVVHMDHHSTSPTPRAPVFPLQFSKALKWQMYHKITKCPVLPHRLCGRTYASVTLVTSYCPSLPNNQLAVIQGHQWLQLVNDTLWLHPEVLHSLACLRPQDLAPVKPHAPEQTLQNTLMELV